MDLFKELKDFGDDEYMYMGNSNKVRGHDKGKVTLKLTSGKILALELVLYILGVGRNIIYGYLLNNIGGMLSFESGK